MHRCARGNAQSTKPIRRARQCTDAERVGWAGGRAGGRADGQEGGRAGGREGRRCEDVACAGDEAHLRGFASYGPAVETGRVVDLAVETGRALLKPDEWSI